MRWGIRVQLFPIAQGHGENEPIPVWPRANVDAGARLPDRLSRLARHRGTRPRDGLFREQGTGVLASLESTSLTPFPGSFIDGRGNGDREAHVAPDEAREAHRRRWHVSTPAGRLGERAILRFTIRERRIFLVVEESRLGPFLARRSGVDAGQAGVDGVQHTRGISVQRRHPEAPLAGRTDELSAQPGHQLLPGLDVHQFQTPTKVDAARSSVASKTRRINMILRNGKCFATGTRHAKSEWSARLRQRTPHGRGTLRRPQRRQADGTGTADSVRRPKAGGRNEPTRVISRTEEATAATRRVARDKEAERSQTRGRHQWTHDPGSAAPYGGQRGDPLSMSVRAKSVPLNSNGSSSDFARA